jgi:NAD+ synthase
MDLMLWAWHHDVSTVEAAQVMGLQPEQIERVYRDIVAKRRMAARLMRDAAKVEEVGLAPKVDVDQT